MGFRLAANLGFLWTDRPFLERIAAAAAAGFDAVEFHDEAQREPLDDVRAALGAAGLPLLGLNARMGDTQGLAAMPGREAEARADIDAAVETARALGGTAVHLLAGRTAPSEEAMETYRANLGHACARAEGLTVLIEPLCAAAVPGYALTTVEQAAGVVAEVGAPNLKIMFDVYHVAQNGDPIAETFARHAPLIGHVQIADPVTRAEPRAGGPRERDVQAIVTALRDAGYAGAFGCEYRPTGAVEDDLGWMDALRRSGEPA